LDTDISEIRFENSFKKVKITGLISASVIENVNGFASNGFTLKSMQFQYIMPKSFFSSDDTFNRLIIESQKIKKGSAVFDASINMKDIILHQKTGGYFIGIQQKFS